MNIQEALNVFGLNGDDLTEKHIKATYKKLALKYHPDRNPLGAELMKAINAAFEMLINNIDNLSKYQASEPEACYNYGEELEAVLNTLNQLNGIIFEVIGNWVWISGETKTHKEALKELRCKWASKKKQWYYRPEEHRSRRNSKEHSIDEIRAKYGSDGQRKAWGRYAVEARAA
ncbi:MAG: DnaJ domain-containing protein [Plesiomonas shigelloides]